jgi:serine/threonine protein kinase
MSVTTPVGKVAHYNLLEPLEPAGPGDLYRARDTRHGRTVVIRLLPRDVAPTSTAGADLLAKVRAVAALSHPNIITVFDAGEHEGRLYLAFEFLKGRSLRAEMAGRPINVRHAVELTIQIADAVADAHAAGFSHGGLSPDSVVVTEKGHAKIPSFDLAARDGFEERGHELRLQDYHSPEEARGEQADERSDVFSVGAVLYDMLTTRRPLHRGSAAPSAANRDVPPALDELVLAAVSPNPNSRHQSAAGFASELRRFLAGFDERSADEPATPPATMSRVMWTTLLSLLALGVLLWVYLSLS